MPDKTKHLEQYIKNKSLANSEPLTQEENNDWRVTIIFYATMHLIESTYSNIPFHAKDHTTRKSFISAVSPYNEIIDHYENLESLSRKARYNCVKIKNKQVAVAIDNMETIEGFAQNLEMS